MQGRVMGKTKRVESAEENEEKEGKPK